jgi:hypothetical protein
MALISCRDCAAEMSTSARHCLRCGSVNRGLKAGEWIALEGDCPLLTHGDIAIASSYFRVGTTVYPLFLISDVLFETRHERPGWTSIVEPLVFPLGGMGLFTGLIFGIGLGIQASDPVGRHQLSSFEIKVVVIALITLALSLATLWLCKRAPDLVATRIQVGDEVGNTIEVLPWRTDEHAFSLASTLAASAGLKTVRRHKYVKLAKY